MKHQLIAADEIEPNSMREVVVGSTSIVVVRTPNGNFHALRNACPHQGALLSHGRLQPIVIGEDVGCYTLSANRFMLRCPWHGYEFNVEDGRCVADPQHVRVRSYPVTIENGMVCIER